MPLHRVFMKMQGKCDSVCLFVSLRNNNCFAEDFGVWLIYEN